MRATLVALTASILVATGLTACSGETSTGSGGATSGTGTSVHIVIKDGKVTPNGDRVKAHVDAPITLHIEADTSGELHVHSSPEQQIEFEKGTSTRTLTIKQPGIVDVEDHALEQVIVQLQVG
jgi:hypothetical protein